MKPPQTYLPQPGAPGPQHSACQNSLSNSLALTPSAAAQCPQWLWVWETSAQWKRALWPSEVGHPALCTLPLGRTPALASPAGKSTRSQCPRPVEACRQEIPPVGPGHGHVQAGQPAPTPHAAPPSLPGPAQLLPDSFPQPGLAGASAYSGVIPPRA